MRKLSKNRLQYFLHKFYSMDKKEDNLKHVFVGILRTVVPESCNASI